MQTTDWPLNTHLMFSIICHKPWTSDRSDVEQGRHGTWGINYYKRQNGKDLKLDNHS